ncbi:MAG: hypothetical protein LQ341_000329 [Variospora aurantia]|nr:MAG: hypothetical protein LQ341_000329 [Variospora aurantia]
MEQKIDGLVALLAQSEDGRASSGLKDGIPSHRSQSSESPSVVANGDQQHAAHSQPGAGTPERVSRTFSGRQSPRTQPTGVSGPAMPRDSLSEQDIHANLPATQMASDYALALDLVDSNYAERLLKEFHTMSDFFPFVLIPSTTRVQALQSRKPMLFLAILMTASGRDRPLQIALEDRYRKEMAAKTIINSHKSLDCLQSILIYLACPQSQQIYQLLLLAISMATDLGILHRRKKPVIEISTSSITEIPTISPEVQREAQRACLACYYLSTSISGALSRPNLLQYSPYMAQCCKELAQAQEHASDVSLTHIISLNRLGEEIQAAFHEDDEDSVLRVEQTRVQMLLRSLERQLKDWKVEAFQDNKQAHVIDLVLLDLSYNFYDMVLHIIGTQLQPSTGITHSSGPTSTISLLDILLSCLEAGKAYLDTILCIPSSQYHYFSFIVWMRLPYVLLKLSKLCFPSEHFAAMRWDVAAARDRVRLELCLESLCYRLQTLTTFNGLSQTQPDFFSSIKLIMEHTRNWYMRKSISPDGKKTMEAGQAEYSPLEVIRDPYESGSTAPMSDNTPAQMSDVGMHPNIEEGVQEGHDNMFSAMNTFADLDGLMDNFDHAFWTSNAFDASIFTEL